MVIRACMYICMLEDSYGHNTTTYPISQWTLAIKPLQHPAKALKDLFLWGRPDDVWDQLLSNYSQKGKHSLKAWGESEVKLNHLQSVYFFFVVLHALNIFIPLWNPLLTPVIITTQPLNTLKLNQLLKLNISWFGDIWWMCVKV